MFIGHHFYTMCFDCDQYIRGEAMNCQYCKAPMHGEIWSHYYGTSDDPKVISDWAEKLKVLNEEEERKREQNLKHGSTENKFLDFVFYTLISLIVIGLIWVSIAWIQDLHF